MSSGILHYAMPAEHSSIDVSNSYDHSGWQPSSPSSSFELWLQPSPSYESSSDIPTHSISSTSSIHGGSGGGIGSVLSSDSHLPSHVDLSSHSGGGLHTQIIASSGAGINSHLGNSGIDIGHHGADVASAHISDNVDFNNIADDIHGKHYGKSYGK